MTFRRALAVVPVVGLLGGVPFVQGADDLSVYPTAGTRTASPTSQISFRGGQPVAPTIHVEGSSSGVHTGKVVAHSDRNGESFIPDTAFSPGETVSVSVTGQTLVGQQNGSVSFKIYTPVPGLKLTPNPDAGGKPKHSQHFRSEPGLLPPSIKVEYKRRGRFPADIFTAPKISRGQDGAMITDRNGRLIWFHKAPKGTSIYDFRTQQLDGKPVLTWWQGSVLFAKGFGKGIIYDANYRKIAQVTGTSGLKPDLHEFQLGPGGVAYTTNYQPVLADVRSVTGSAKPEMAAVFDCVIQGIDIKTGLVVFEWHAMDHVPLSDTYARYFRGAAAPFDPYHLNSVEPESNGKLLLSARNTNAAYEVDPSTGAIQWTLGGKHSDFHMLQGTTFIAQHDVRRLPNGDVTVFDNGTGVPGVGGRPARGIVIHLDMSAKTATLVQKFKRRSKTFAPSQGNVQGLPNGNFFVGWGGSSPYMSEFSSAGKLIFDARFNPSDNNSYRSYRFPWSARPYYPPKIALTSAKGNKTKVYITWNGATDVSSWEVLAGSSPSSLSSVKTVHYNAFETSTKISNKYRYVAVRGHAGDGSVLDTSATVKR